MKEENEKNTSVSQYIYFNLFLSLSYIKNLKHGMISEIHERKDIGILIRLTGRTVTFFVRIH